MQIQNLVSVRVDKAIDDQGQKLAQIANTVQNPAPNQGGAGFGGFGLAGGPIQGGAGLNGMLLPAGMLGGNLGGMGQIGFGMVGFGGMMGFQGGALNHHAVVTLKKGEKAAKTLKEVTGAITAQILRLPSR